MNATDGWQRAKDVTPHLHKVHHLAACDAGLVWVSYSNVHRIAPQSCALLFLSTRRSPDKKVTYLFSFFFFGIIFTYYCLFIILIIVVNRMLLFLFVDVFSCAWGRIFYREIFVLKFNFPVIPSYTVHCTTPSVTKPHSGQMFDNNPWHKTLMSFFDLIKVGRKVVHRRSEKIK